MTKARQLEPGQRGWLAEGVTRRRSRWPLLSRAERAFPLNLSFVPTPWDLHSSDGTTSYLLIRRLLSAFLLLCFLVISVFLVTVETLTIKECNSVV